MTWYLYEWFVKDELTNGNKWYVHVSTFYFPEDCEFAVFYKDVNGAPIQSSNFLLEADSDNFVTVYTNNTVSVAYE